MLLRAGASPPHVSQPAGEAPWLAFSSAGTIVSASRGPITTLGAHVTHARVVSHSVTSRRAAGRLLAGLPAGWLAGWHWLAGPGWLALMVAGYLLLDLVDLPVVASTAVQL